VLVEHLRVVHFVDVIARENEDVFGALAADGIDVLIDGVGGALIPLLGDAHLRGQDFDVIAEAGDGGPASADVTIAAKSFVLGEDKNFAEVGIDAVGKGDVDDAVESAEGNCGLGAVAGEGPKAFALASSEKDCNGIAHDRHGWTPAVRMEAAHSTQRAVGSTSGEGEGGPGKEK
jgi:hypothetical protein